MGGIDKRNYGLIKKSKFELLKFNYFFLKYFPRKMLFCGKNGK